MSTHEQRDEWRKILDTEPRNVIVNAGLKLRELLDDVARLERERDDERLLTAKYHQLVGATANDRDDALRHLRAVLDDMPFNWPSVDEARAFLAAHEKETR